MPRGDLSTHMIAEASGYLEETERKGIWSWMDIRVWVVDN